MLAALGYPSRAALIDAIVPAAIRRSAPLALPGAMTEAAALARLKAIAAKNRVLKSFIGQGYYGTHTPGVILRNVLENPAWYTAYTPYQPEISQGRLEALVNFQTMVCDLTGMAIANASMLDEATAAAEAMTLCQRIGRSRSRAVLRRRRRLPADDRRRAHARGAARASRSSSGPAADAAKAGAFAVLLQYPGADGDVRDYRGARRRGARGWRARRRRRRPARADAAGAARRMGRRRRRRLGAALRRADGLRRPARRLPRDPRRLQALDAGPPRRRHRRRERRPRVPARAADARAAHPAREGDVEHLHGAGAARGDRRHVRGLPRARGSDHDRAARPPADRDPARRASSGSGYAVPTAHFFDTITVATGARRDAILDRGVALRDELPPDRRAHAGPVARRDDDARRRRGDLARVRRRRRRRVPADALRERADALPGGAAAHARRSSRIRRSTATTPKPRCCATCAGSPTATSRSTAR